MIIGDMVFVKGNIGIVTNGTFVGDYLVQGVMSIGGITKTIEQWYSGDIVFHFFISEIERDTYFVTNPDSLVAGLIVYVKDLGKYQYTDSAWVAVTAPIPVINPNIFDILGQRFTTTFGNAIDGLNTTLNDVKSVETLAFVATIDGTSFIDFNNLVGLNLSTATFNLYYKGLRFDKNNYVINVDLKSITLTGWVINKNDTVTLEYTTKN